MPTAATHTFAPSGRLDPKYKPELALEQHVQLSDGTYAKGTVLGEITATPGIFAPYVDANVNGTGVARGVLKFACVVASGAISISNEFGVTRRSAPMYVSGFFDTSELTGLDAAGVADLNGLLVNGTVTAGVLHF